MKKPSKTSAIQATTMSFLFLISPLLGESQPPSSQPFSFTKLLYKQCNSKDNPNANALVTTLATNAPLGGFSMSVEGNGSEKLYGVLECRGDLNKKECAACSSVVVSEQQNHCKDSSSVWLQLEGCYLRYERYPFFWKHHDFYELYHQCGMGENRSYYSFNPDDYEVLEEVLFTAPFHNGFSAAGNNKSGTSTYALANCNAYLSPDDCAVCLRVGLYFLQFDCMSPDYMGYEEEAGGVIVLDSCFLRFDKYRFFDQEEKGAWWNTKFPSAPPSKIKKLAIAISCGVVGGAIFALCLVGIYVKIKARKRLAQVHCIAVDGEVTELSNVSTNIPVANPQASNT
ncbi:plasmodesmata-located protein 8 [Cryptomeria japonica]|uniref:plasmodesmata-located protein 8 n=1 Tax=Cryptomeria japonica TaxID=3369 RepID=UPI0027DA6D13|nr:plasmodesmata-located protein 8 [Cryptomeria japonica]